MNINIKVFSFSRKVVLPKQLMQFGIIAVVVLASMIISYWGTTIALVLALVAVGAVAVTIGLILRPNLGFVLIYLSGMFVPFAGGGGVNAATLMVAFMLGLWFLEMLVVKQQFVIIRSYAMLPVIVFLIISILSFGMGQIPWFIVFAHQAPIASQIGGFVIFAFSIGALLLAAHQIKDLQWLEIITWVFVGLGAVYVLGRTVHFPYIDRLYQHGFVSGSMFWTWMIALTFSQFLYNEKLKPNIKRLCFIIMLLTFYVAIVQGYAWKSGWVPPFAVMLVLLSVRYKKIIVFGIPFVLIGIVYMAINLIAADDYSWGTRVDAWKIILEISRVSPFFGMGFSNYYWYTPLFPIRGYSVSFNSHSQYVDLIAQTGYLGLFCFFWIFITLGRLSWDIAKRLPGGFAKAYANGALAGIIGTLIGAYLGDWVLPFVYNVGLTGFRASVLPWIFLGGLISIEQIYFKK